VAMRMRFAGNAAERELAAFTARAAAECERAGVLLSQHQAEILVRSTLGPVDIGDFNPAHIDVLEGFNSLLAILMREWRPAGAELDELLMRTASLGARSRAFMPGMALLDKLTEVLATGTVPEELEPELEAALDATAYELGRLMFQAGDAEGAKALLARAADSADPQWSIPASVHLGAVLQGMGDWTAARAVFERVVTSRRPSRRTAACSMATTGGQLLWRRSAWARRWNSPATSGARRRRTSEPSGLDRRMCSERRVSGCGHCPSRH